jgi:hypothetical protein
MCGVVEGPRDGWALTQTGPALCHGQSKDQVPNFEAGANLGPEAGAATGHMHSGKPTHPLLSL